MNFYQILIAHVIVGSAIVWITATAIANWIYGDKSFIKQLIDIMLMIAAALISMWAMFTVIYTWTH